MYWKKGKNLSDWGAIVWTDARPGEAAQQHLLRGVNVSLLVQNVKIWVRKVIKKCSPLALTPVFIQCSTDECTLMGTHLPKKIVVKSSAMPTSQTTNYLYNSRLFLQSVYKKSEYERRLNTKHTEHLQQVVVSSIVLHWKASLFLVSRGFEVKAPFMLCTMLVYWWSEQNKACMDDGENSWMNNQYKSNCVRKSGSPINRQRHTCT